MSHQNKLAGYTHLADGACEGVFHVVRWKVGGGDAGKMDHAMAARAADDVSAVVALAAVPVVAVTLRLLSNNVSLSVPSRNRNTCVLAIDDRIFIRNDSLH